MGFFDVTKSSSFKFEDPGDSVTGVVTKVFEGQRNKFKNGKMTDDLDFWDNGDPKMQVGIILQTKEIDDTDPDDKGRRGVYAPRPSRLFTAIQKAIQKVGAEDIEIGATLTVKFTDYDPESANPKNPAKMYTAKYVLPVGGSFKDDDDDDDEDEVDPAALKAALRARKAKK